MILDLRYHFKHHIQVMVDHKHVLFNAVLQWLIHTVYSGLGIFLAVHNASMLVNKLTENET